MYSMIWFVLIIFVIYTLLIGAFALAQWRLLLYKPQYTKKSIGFSILIPFRNEALNLPSLLQAIAQLEYPTDHYEILLINDDSQDTSLDIVNTFIASHTHLNIVCIHSVRTSGSPKKDALTLGVQQSQYDWIVTTDADCVFPSAWLSTLNSFIQEKQPKMVAGPVAITTTSTPSFANAFEQLDSLSLMGATMGGFGLKMPFMCNGAHLAYEKKAFIEQEGFSKNTHIASGDDHFLLEKFTKAYPHHVQYLKSPQAIVTTQAQKSWKDLISQRIRWASKASAYNFWFSKAVGLLVLLANLLTVVFLIFIPLLVFSDFAFAKAKPLPLLTLSLFLKWAVDYILIARNAYFFNRKSFLKYYPILLILYPFVNLYITIRSLFFTYEWKGRRFSK